MTEEVKEVNMDNSLETTQLYDTIYKSLVDSQKVYDNDSGQYKMVDVLKSDFDNYKLRNIILMLLLANSVKLDPNVAFKLVSDNQFALEQQLIANNGGRPLTNEQNISFKKQENSEVPYAELLSYLKIQKNDLTFVFNRDTESFNKIIEIAEQCGFELPKQLEYSTKTDTEKKEFINTQIQLTKDLWQKYDESLKEFKKNANITNLKSFIYSAINSLDDAIQIFNFIQNPDQKKQLKESVGELVDKFNEFAQSLYSNPIFKEKIEQRKQLVEEIRTLEGKITALKKQIGDLKKEIQNLENILEEKLLELQTKNKKLLDLNKLSHIQIFDKIQRFDKQWNTIQQQRTEELPQFQIFFDTRYGMKYCKDNRYEELAFTLDNNSYSHFILEVMLPIIHQLAFTGIEKTNPELITKIIGGQYNNIIHQRIVQILQEALNKHQPPSELTLNNLLDEDLIKVYDIAILFTNPQGRSVQLTDGQTKRSNQILLQINSARRINNEALAQTILGQVKKREISFTLSYKEKKDLTEEQIQQKLKTQIDQICAMVEIAEIARTTKNPEVLKAISEQECFRLNINILLEISKNPNVDSDTLFNCAYYLKYISKNSKNLEIQKQCIEGIKEILKNPNANSKILSNCAYYLRNIVENSKDPEIQKQCIEGIIKIPNTVDKLTLSKCVSFLRRIVCFGRVGDDIKEQCIEGIIKIANTADEKTSYDCVSVLERIACFDNGVGNNIKQQCVEGIIEISKNSKVDLVSNLESIVYYDTFGNNIKQQCVDRIKEISNTADEGTLRLCISALGRLVCANRVGDDIKEQCINKIIKIANTADEKTLCECVPFLGRIAYSDRFDNIKQQCINKIIEISNIADKDTLRMCVSFLGSIACSNRFDNIKQQCINRIIEISNIADKDTLRMCVSALKDIIDSGRVGYDIKQQCIEGIINIPNTADEKTLCKCVSVFKNIIDSDGFGDDVKLKCIDGIIRISCTAVEGTFQKCVSALKDIIDSGRVGYDIKQQRSKVIDKIIKKNEDNYIQSSMLSPTSSVSNSINTQLGAKKIKIEKECTRDIDSFYQSR